jgi:hypothetical protein
VEIDMTALDVYVGVSSGALIAAGVANRLYSGFASASRSGRAGSQTVGSGNAQTHAIAEPPPQTQGAMTPFQHSPHCNFVASVNILSAKTRLNAPKDAGRMRRAHRPRHEEGKS